MRKKTYPLLMLFLAVYIIMSLVHIGESRLALASNTADISLLEIRTKAVTDTGFDLEITVNDTAVNKGAVLTYAYTTDPNLAITGSNIGDSRIITNNSIGLSSMRLVRKTTYQSIYSVSIKAEMPRTYNIYAILRTSESETPVKSFTLVSNKDFSRYTYVVPTDQPTPSPTPSITATPTTEPTHTPVPSPTITPVPTATISPTPVPQKGSIAVLKQDAYTGVKLVNAVFELTDVSTGQVVGTKTSDATGVALFSDLPLGSYEIREAQPPLGYKPYTVTHSIVLSPSNLNDTLTINNEGIGSVTIQKIDAYDSSKLLQGAVFKLIRDQVEFTRTTDTNGNAIFDSLPYGNYLFEEITAPNGYVLVSAASVAVAVTEVSPDKTVAVTNKQEPLGKITVKKLDSVTKKPLGGAVINLEKPDGSIISGVTASGLGTVVFDKLDYGNYYISEAEAPAGYIINKTTYPKTISEISPHATLDIENDGIGSITIIKRDSDNAALLDGAEFRLTRDGVVLSAQAKNNGVYLFEKVPFGDFVITEQKAPFGYDMINSTYNVSLNESMSDYDYIMTVTNERIPPLGDLIIDKYEAGDTSLKLEGAEFELWLGGNYFDKGVTDANGQLIFPNLPLGNYTLVEIVPPNGYELDATPITVVLSGSDAIPGNPTRLYDKVIPIPNTPTPKGTITVLKLDDTYGTPLQGGVFELTRLSDGTVFTGETGINGRYTFTDLILGDYTLEEVVQPAGYLLNANPETRSVTIANLNHTIEVRNTKVPDGIDHRYNIKVKLEWPVGSSTDWDTYIYKNYSSSKYIYYGSKTYAENNGTDRMWLDIDRIGINSTRPEIVTSLGNDNSTLSVLIRLCSGSFVNFTVSVYKFDDVTGDILIKRYDVSEYSGFSYYICDIIIGSGGDDFTIVDKLGSPLNLVP